MSRVLINTNAYTALLAGDGRIADALAKSDAVLLSPVVVGERLDGFLNGARAAADRAALERFRAKPRTVGIPITADTAEWFARIKRALRAKSRPLPANDVWIAASCLEHGAKLISFDAHFVAVDGLLRWEPEA